MKPSPAIEGKMAKVEGFIQQNPKDGAPASEPTVVYLGYTDKRIYIIFVAFDSRPDLVRARMTRRENIYDDDRVQVMFDSFHDPTPSSAIPSASSSTNSSQKIRARTIRSIRFGIPKGKSHRRVT
ncbi:MAG TPA: hypothetical protein VJN69_02090 [Candidatus Acidoferrales bacterium]|nr:hypothetical protein [Candidatus Acidoferrales bacterium]